MSADRKQKLKKRAEKAKLRPHTPPAKAVVNVVTELSRYIVHPPRAAHTKYRCLIPDFDKESYLEDVPDDVDPDDFDAPGPREERWVVVSAVSPEHAAGVACEVAGRALGHDEFIGVEVGDEQRVYNVRCFSGTRLRVVHVVGTGMKDVITRLLTDQPMKFDSIHWFEVTTSLDDVVSVTPTTTPPEHLQARDDLADFGTTGSAA